MSNNKSPFTVINFVAITLGLITGLVIVAVIQNSKPNAELVAHCGSANDTVEEVFRGDFGTTKDGTPINSSGIPVQPDGSCKLNAQTADEVFRRVPSEQYLKVLSEKFGYIYTDDQGLTRGGRKYEFGIKLWGKGVPGVSVNDDAPIRNHD